MAEPKERYMGNGPTPAAPAATDPGPGGLEGADQAARDRLANAFPDGVQPGAPAEVAAAATGAPVEGETPFDIFAENALEGLDLGNLQYRDGAKLQKEIGRARDQFKPFHDAFGSLDEESRASLLANAPNLGNDLATFSAVASRLDPSDRAYFMAAMDLLATDPIRAAEALGAGADSLRQAFGMAPGAAPASGTPGQAAPLPAGQQAMPEWAQPDAPVDPENAPVTRADLAQWKAEQDYAAEIRANEADIIHRATELGYAPNPNDPVANNRFRSFIGLLQDTSGDADAAHALMQQADQAIIDGFVQAKAADAGRPGAPAMGAAPAETRVLETLDDGRAAMLARLDGSLGPDPRRRSAED